MSKTRVNITEDMIRDAAKAYGRAMLASRADDIKNHSTKLTASKMLNRQRHVLRTAVCIFAAVVLIGGFFTVDASARERFVSWVRSIFENRVEYRFEGKPPAQYDPLFPADFSLSSPDNVVCTVDTDTRKEYGIDAGANSYNLIYMLSTEYDFSSEIGPEYAGSEVWINGLEGTYYKALQENVPDLMIWHDAYDIVYILESAAGQEAMQAFAENIRLDYHLDHAVCYNGAISHADFSLIEDEYVIECVVDEIQDRTFVLYNSAGEVICIYDYYIVTDSIAIGFGYDTQEEYNKMEVIVGNYGGEYYDYYSDEYDALVWLDQDAGVFYSLQMDGDANAMIRLAESIVFTQ